VRPGLPIHSTMTTLRSPSSGLRSPTALGTALAVTTGVGLAALYSFAPARDALRFAPEAGAKVSKTFSTEFDMDLDEFSLMVSGQDIGGMLGTPGFQISGTVEVAFTDEYLELGEGRPEKLQRTFDTLASETSVAIDMMGESQEQGGSATSPLDGLSVVFTWDEEASDYTVTFAEESKGDAELLEGQLVDSDLRALLPSGDVAEGATWSFEPQALKTLFMPGGDLHWETEGMDEADMAEFEEMMSKFTDRGMEALEALLDGEGTATYVGTKEIEGRRAGVVQLQASVSSTADLASLLQDIIDEAMAEAGDEVPADASVSVETADLSLDTTAEGELHWDLESGTLLGLTMTSDAELAVDLSIAAEGGGESQDIEASISFSGVLKFQVDSER
jgi:hypothetical protein